MLIECDLIIILVFDDTAYLMLGQDVPAAFLFILTGKIDSMNVRWCDGYLGLACRCQIVDV